MTRRHRHRPNTASSIAQVCVEKIAPPTPQRATATASLKVCVGLCWKNFWAKK